MLGGRVLWAHRANLWSRSGRTHVGGPSPPPPARGAVSVGYGGSQLGAGAENAAPDEYTLHVMTHSIQPIDPSEAVEVLLSTSHLPISDLHDGNVQLFGCWAGNGLCGVVGLELHGQAALLRSLAVPATERGSGLGAALVAHAERFATQRGVDTIYLLTTTASTFFERQGYRHVSRENAPKAIASTRQFSGLCPSSSAFMAKALAAPPRR